MGFYCFFTYNNDECEVTVDDGHQSLSINGNEVLSMAPTSEFEWMCRIAGYLLGVEVNLYFPDLAIFKFNGYSVNIEPVAGKDFVSALYNIINNVQHYLQICKKMDYSMANLLED